LKRFGAEIMDLRDFLYRGVLPLIGEFTEAPYVPVVKAQPSIGHTGFKLTSNYSASGRGRIEATGTANYSGTSVTGPFWSFLAGDVVRISGSSDSSNNGLWTVHSRVNGGALDFTAELGASVTSDSAVTVELYERTFNTP
jgi:hypothetical protein